MLKMKTCFGILLAFLATANSLLWNKPELKAKYETRQLGDIIVIGDNPVEEKWFQQPLDHFNATDNRKWNMRYLERSEFYNGTGPMFVFLGAENEIRHSLLHYGLIPEFGEIVGALLMATEHRFYGQSIPNNDMSRANLEYLSFHQVLGDYAKFIAEMKKKWNVSKVVVFGESYGGMLAAFLKTGYPDLITGAVSSSGAVKIELEVPQFYGGLGMTYKKFNADCAEQIEIAFRRFEKLLDSEKGAALKTKKLFNACETFNADSKQEVAWALNVVAEKFGYATMFYSSSKNGYNDMDYICNDMTDRNISDPLDRLANFMVNDNFGCTDLSYKKFIAQLKDDSYNHLIMGSWPMRPYWFTQCTEMASFQTGTDKRNIFGKKYDLDFFINLCQDAYGHDLNKAAIENNMKKVLDRYAVNGTSAKNIIFTNGEIDIWRHVSVTEDLNESSHAIVIKGEGHCKDFDSDYPSDSIHLLEARNKLRTIIRQWVQQ